MKISPKLISGFLLLPTLATGISSALGAAYIGRAYDSMNYPDGSSLLNANGGTGWNPSGDASTNTTTWNQYSGGTAPLVSGTGLDYLGSGYAQESGGKAVYNGATASNLGRSIAQVPETGTLYISYLIDKNVDTVRTVNFSLSGATTAASTTFSEKAAFGQTGTTPGTGSNGTLRLTTAAVLAPTLNGTQSASPVTFGIDSVHLVVVKIVFGANLAAASNDDQVTTWLYNGADAVPLGEPANFYEQSNTVDINYFNGFRVFVGAASGTAPNNSLAASADFDEIRFGTSWAAVVVPEPGVLVSLAGGMGCLVGLRRRRAV